MYVFGRLRCRQRDKTKGNQAGVVRPAGCIDNGGRVVTGLPFLIGAIKKNRLCTKKSLII